MQKDRGPAMDLVALSTLLLLDPGPKEGGEATAMVLYRSGDIAQKDPGWKTAYWC